MSQKEAICLALIITTALIMGTIIGYKINQILKINKVLKEDGYCFNYEQIRFIHGNRRKYIVTIIAAFLAYVAISVFIGGIMYA